ncbi:MAG: c-type cytochrome [Gammaproteobacteria bacterium]|jgi:cytochrome c oxidase subunit 2
MKLQFTLAMAALVSLYSATSLAAGDAAKGKVLFATCGACHGANGEGQEALNAPRLQGQQDWYVIRQLQNFKAGIRGANPKDTFGMQMAPMSQTLPNDQAMADVAAYIKTLK